MSILKTIYLQHLNGANANMTLDSSGRVGIGNTSPSFPLHVGGEIFSGRSDSSAEGGQISLGRSSDNFAHYNIDCYGGSTTPSLRFIDAAAGAVRMNIDSSGRVTTPFQPGARVLPTAQSAINFTAGNTIVVPFNNIVEETGSNFNTSTYRYTAPVAGRYMITASAQGNSMSTSNLLLLMIRVNGSGRFGTYQNGNGLVYQPLYTSGSTYVNAGDYFDVGIYSSQTSGSLELGSPDTRNMFSIYLLG